MYPLIFSFLLLTMMNRNKAAEPGDVVIYIVVAGCHEFKHHERRTEFY